MRKFPAYIVYHSFTVVCEIFDYNDPRNWGEKNFTVDLFSAGLLVLRQQIEHYMDFNIENEKTYVFVLYDIMT